MKKGFTLIELLAVIVILAIIAVIAVPIVIDVIDDTKINSLKTSTSMYLKASELYISNEQLNKVKITPGTYPITKEGNICIGKIEDKKCNGEEIKIDVKGNKPNKGQVIIDENTNIKLDYLEINGYNCYQNKTNYDCKKAGDANLESTNGLITIEDSKTTSLSNYRIYGNIEEYQPVEYIESTGTQYIDTGFKPNQNTRVVTDYQLIDLVTSFIFGSRTNLISDSYNVNIGSNGTAVFTTYGTSGDLNIADPDTNRHKIDKNKNLFYIDDKLLKTFEEQTFTSPGPLEIFATYDSNKGKGYLPSVARIYYFKIYDNDKLVRDYIPCYRKSDGEVGLFDLVDNMFYGNNGTGVFNKGQDVTIDNILLEGLGNYNLETKKYEIPLKITEKNLMKSNAENTNTAYGVTISSKIGESKFSLNGICTSDWGHLLAMKGPVFKPGKYKIKIEGPQNLHKYFVQEYYLDGTHKQNIITDAKMDTTYSFEVKEEVQLVIGIVLKIDVNYNDEYKVIIQTDDYSENIIYEPYKEENYMLELDAPLRCVNDVCDYVDYIKEKIIRNVGFNNEGNLIKLEESYLEDIELPEIKINKGISNIFIETDIKPSKVSVNYHK